MAALGGLAAAAALTLVSPAVAGTTRAGTHAAPLGAPATKEPSRLTEDEATRAALEQPKVTAWLRRYPPDPTTSATFRHETRTWVVRAWSGEAGEIALATVEDTTGRVTEAWTGPQVAWKMARGRKGAFGGKTLMNPYVWVSLCVLFLLGLADLRKPLSVRNFDLLALVAFSVSLAFFNRGEIFRSVPLVYPPLVYLLGRGLWVGIRGRGDRLRPVWPVWALAVAAVFLVGFRVGLNIQSPRGVIDVGLAGVIGANRIANGEAPYGHMPVRDALEPCGPADAEGDVRDRIQTNGRCESANEHGDTYGPVAYLAYVPAYLAFGWSGKWDSLPAAHATSIAFDLLTLLGLVLVGLRFGGSRLAAALAFGWVAYPFTAYTLNANTNDTILPAALVWGFWLVSSPWARGTAVGLAGWTKFGALLVAPLWATYPRFRRGGAGRFALAFAATSVAAFGILLLEPSLWTALRTFWDRTIDFQFGRHSPFSLWDWGQYHAAGIPDLAPGKPVLAVLAVVLALAVAVVPRRKGPVELAALTAAVLVAFQLPLTHWFYLYLPWVVPFVLLWLLLPAQPTRYQSQESTTGYDVLESRQSAAKSAAPMSPVQSE